MLSGRAVSSSSIHCFLLEDVIPPGPAPWPVNLLRVDRLLLLPPPLILLSLWPEGEEKSREFPVPVHVLKRAMRCLSRGWQAGRFATNMPTFISAEAQARMSLRFSSSRVWSFRPIRNFRRTMGAMDALVYGVSLKCWVVVGILTWSRGFVGGGKLLTRFPGPTWP